MLSHAYPAETWLPYFMIAVEFLSGIAWPIAVVVVLIKLGPNLSNLVGNLSEFKIGKDGAAIAFSQPTSRASDELRGNIDSSIENLHINDEFLTLKENFRSDLTKVAPGEPQDFLLSALTRERLDKVFALAYANIFGSQIRALKALSERGGIVSIEEAQAEFEVLQNEIPVFKDWNLTRYVNFLKRYEFITENEGNFQITGFGKSFLKFLVDQGLSENRLH